MQEVIIFKKSVENSPSVGELLGQILLDSSRCSFLSLVQGKLGVTVFTGHVFIPDLFL